MLLNFIRFSLRITVKWNFEFQNRSDVFTSRSSAQNDKCNELREGEETGDGTWFVRATRHLREQFHADDISTFAPVDDTFSLKICLKQKFNIFLKKLNLTCEFTMNLFK